MNSSAIDTPPPRIHALIPCAGSGSRAATTIPKQYQVLAGRPLVMHTLAAFLSVPRVATVLLAVAPGDDRHPPESPPLRVAHCGGATRAATVASGLARLQDLGARPDDWVLVHDAARCLVTPALIERLIDACADDPVGGLLAQPLADTLKREAGSGDAGDAGDRVQATVAREGLWLAQTPQMFRLGVLAHALAQAGEGVTDEASAIERAGLRPRLVPGSPRNLKVTWPDDFLLAEALLGRTS